MRKQLKELRENKRKEKGIKKWENSKRQDGKGV